MNGLLMVWGFIVSCTVLALPVAVSFANHGQEITISRNSVDLISTASKQNATKIDIYLNYRVNDGRAKEQPINSVMKIYHQNGSLLKTSSSQQGFRINDTGTHHHVTTITSNATPNMKAVIQFTDLSKTLPFSNPLEINLDLNKTREEISAFPTRK
jgi:hypothetical protein